MREPLRILPGFFKAHGHGNDYLVFEEGDGVALTAGLVRRICDRHRGPGADGVVVVEASGEGAAVREGRDAGPGGSGGAPEGGEVRLRMFNPDGGEFERSGNGLRIAGVYLRRRGRVGAGWFPVVAGGERVRVRVPRTGVGGVWDASVEMGRIGFPSGPPFVAPGSVGEHGHVSLALPSADGAGRVRMRAVPVSVGNPHAVVFGRRRSRAEVEHYGALIGAAPAFPQGTNVQFVEVGDGGGAAGGRGASGGGEAAGTRAGARRGEIRVRVWERGVGWTSASGTSACATVAAAVKSGLIPFGRVAVRMEGGVMEVELGEDWAARLHGPVEEVCEGVLAGRLAI